MFVRSMCMSIFWLPAPMVAVWRVSGMWGSVVGSLVCGPVVCVVSDMWRVSGMWGSVVCGGKWDAGSVVCCGQCYVGAVVCDI